MHTVHVFELALTFMASVVVRNQYPWLTGVLLLLFTVAGMTPLLSAPFVQYVLIAITIGFSVKRALYGPDRSVFITIIIALLTLFFSVLGTNYFFPNNPYIELTIAPILSYATAVITVEVAQHVRWRTTILNSTSALVIFAALLFVQLWEGPAFQHSFMFGTMHCLLMVWLIGKALEIQPWLHTMPLGLRVTDLGFIFIILSVSVHTLNLTVPDYPWVQTAMEALVPMHLANIGLVFIALAAMFNWPIQVPEETVNRYGFSQDITAAFIPLIFGIAGTSMATPVTQIVLGGAALVSTSILLIEMDSLQKELNVINQSVTTIAVTDPITNLPNRYALAHHLNQPISGVTIVDVEGLRPVNSTHGFMVGDQILREFAHRLTSRVQNRGTILRSSGNEFIILWQSRVLDIESRLRSTIAIPFDIDQDQVYLSLFVGTVMDDDLDPRTLVHAAYVAKVHDRQAI